MKFKRFSILFFLLVCSCTVSQKQEIAQVEEGVSPEKPTYFVRVPITKYSSIQSPCVDIGIEDRVFSVELDLGYRGDLTVTKQSADLISSKNFIREKPMYGIRGKEYSTNLYRIPEVKIGKMTFFKPILQEEGEEFIKDATFVQNGGEPSQRDPGRLGWELFYNVNLLIDTKNSSIAFCDSLKTLQQHGYRVENFICTPLFLDQGLVEFFAETSEGRLRCMLDTGATWNILNSEIAEGQSIDQAMWDAANIIKYSSFRIDGKDFGPLTFHRIPIRAPIQIEAILGMEFFEENLVFLDFSEKTAYFLQRPHSQ